MNTIKKIVLTGGPCGGKTDIINGIADNYGKKVIIVPEIATKILAEPYEEGGVGIPGKDLEWSQEWQNNFQERVLFEQLKAEEEALKLAETEGIEIIICDRGILDGAAYLEGGVKELTERFMLSHQKCLESYDIIIHLNSLATDRPDEYEKMKSSNPCRFETTERARELDQNLSKAWEKHPKHHKIAATETFEEKWQACLAALEIEEEIKPETVTEKAETNESNQEIEELRIEFENLRKRFAPTLEETRAYEDQLLTEAYAFETETKQ